MSSRVKVPTLYWRPIQELGQHIDMKVGENMPSKNYTTPLAERQVAAMFTYHPPKDDQTERYTELRAAARMFATAIITNCPDSQERDAALLRISEAVMHANAAIARNE